MAADLAKSSAAAMAMAAAGMAKQSEAAAGGAAGLGGLSWGYAAAMGKLSGEAAAAAGCGVGGGGGDDDATGGGGGGGREVGCECWVVQASPEWSNARAAADADVVANELRDAFLALVGRRDAAVGMGNQSETATPGVAHCKAVKWKHAYPLRPTESDYFYDAANGVGACGDWTGGARASDAYDAGVKLGRAVADSINSTAGS